jgi:hypothetical protein
VVSYPDSFFRYSGWMPHQVVLSSIDSERPCVRKAD